jgi:hypothetical protein
MTRCHLLTKVGATSNESFLKETGFLADKPPNRCVRNIRIRRKVVVAFAR